MSVVTGRREGVAEVDKSDKMRETNRLMTRPKDGGGGGARGEFASPFHDKACYY